MGAKYTDAQKRAAVKYLSEKTDLVQLRIPKGSKERYKEYSDKQGKSLTALIVELLEHAIKASGGGDPPE